MARRKAAEPEPKKRRGKKPGPKATARKVRATKTPKKRGPGRPPGPFKGDKSKIIAGQRRRRAAEHKAGKIGKKSTAKKTGAKRVGRPRKTAEAPKKRTRRKSAEAPKKRGPGRPRKSSENSTSVEPKKVMKTAVKRVAKGGKVRKAAVMKDDRPGRPGKR